LKIPVEASFFSVTADWELHKLAEITTTGSEERSLKRATNKDAGSLQISYQGSSQ
jgi:hypothetical protein